MVAVSEQTTSGMTGLVEDVLSVIPRDELFLMFLEKLDGSTEFANFVECFGTPEFAKHVEQLQVCVCVRYFAHREQQFRNVYAPRMRA